MTEERELLARLGAPFCNKCPEEDNHNIVYCLNLCKECLIYVLDGHAGKRKSKIEIDL